MSFRGFISVDIEAAASLRDIHVDLNSVGPGLKPVEPSLVHITLKFLGDTREDRVQGIVASMRDVVSGIAPFRIALKGAGAFPARGPARVIWVGIENGELLATMAARLEDGLVKFGFAKESRPFKSHLTVARVKDISASANAVAVAHKYRDHEFGEFEVRAIRLKKSVLTPKGPIYSTVEEVPLA